MYKGASQIAQTHLNRMQVTDAGLSAARMEPISKAQARKNFARAMAEIDRQITMARPGSPRRKELGLHKLAMQRLREQEKGVGIVKVNAKRISDIFREKVFAILPDDAQRLWDEAATTEAHERELALTVLEREHGTP